MMQTEPPHVFSSPSFSSYSSSETFAQIAARVIHELRLDPHYNNHLNDDNLFDPWPQNDNHNHDDHPHPHPHANDNNVDANGDDFEFSFVSRDPNNSSPVSADEIFHNGQIAPTYPLFGRDILNGVVSVPAETATVRRRSPLRALMFEERETTMTTSCSSSEDSSSKGLEGVAEGTYCVWSPRACKKSSSAGSSSSRRWKLRNLLLIRSHSDGKEPIMFLGSAKRTNNKVVPKHGGPDGSAAMKGGEQGKRKSFLPYRQELVRLFGNGNIGVGRDSQSS